MSLEESDVVSQQNIGSISLNWINLIKPTNCNNVVIGEHEMEFDIEPLERGFGFTLGGMLRRCLLSSLHGMAISAVRIEGISHEFTGIDGVKEDMIDVILNLKSVVFKGDVSFSNKKFTLSASGIGAVTAGMIKTSDGFSVVNKDLVICNITQPDASIDMDLIVSFGKGYKAANDHDNLGYGVGFISIDSIYSPVVNCSYTVKHSRIGSETEYDRLLFVVKTNGSITPDLALGLGAKILQEQLGAFVSFKDVQEVVKPKEDELPFSVHLLRKIVDTTISVRPQNCCKNDNLVYIGDLVVKTEAQMLKTPNFGRKSLEEIKQMLEEYGLCFGMVVPEWPPKNIQELAKKYLEE